MAEQDDRERRIRRGGVRGGQKKGHEGGGEEGGVGVWRHAGGEAYDPRDQAAEAVRPR